MCQSVSMDNRFSKQLAKDIYKLSKAATTDEVLNAGSCCVLDFFAGALAALNEPIAKRISMSIKKFGDAPQATVLVNSESAPAPFAALANGTLGHALDYDDTLWTYIGHSTAVILPAALAVAEIEDCGGKEMLAAFSLGVEVAHRIGAPITPDLSKFGWHASPSVGVFGAAASASLLTGGDVNSLSRAISLATNMSSGIKENFGSSAKPFVIGWASHAGVIASIFAQQGFSGSEEAFEGKQGFYKTFVKRLPNSLNDVADNKMAIVSPGVSFKLYPSCTGTHPSIEAIISLRQQKEIRINEISHIRIEVTPEVPHELIYPIPSSPSQGKFSLPYCVAIALIYGDVGLEHFKDEYLANPDVKDIMKRVEVVSNENLSRETGDHNPAAKLTIDLYAGEKIEKTVNSAKGSPGKPLTLKDLKNKFRKCAQWAGLSPRKTEQFIEEILSLRSNQSISSWMKKYVAPMFKEISNY